MNVGNFICNLRNTKGLFLPQNASAIEIDQAILSKLERKERMSAMKHIIQ
jgi:hypothetical protein